MQSLSVPLSRESLEADSEEACRPQSPQVASGCSDFSEYNTVVTQLSCIASGDLTDDTHHIYKEDQQDLGSVWTELRYLKFCLETEVETRTKSLEHLAQEVKSCREASAPSSDIIDLNVVRDSVSCIATVLDEFRKDSVRKSADSEAAIFARLNNVHEEIKRHASQLEVLEKALTEVKTSMDEDIRRFTITSFEQMQSFNRLRLDLEGLSSRHEGLLKDLGKSAADEAFSIQKQNVSILETSAVTGECEAARSLNYSPKNLLHTCDESIPMIVAGCSRECESAQSLNSSPNQILQRSESIPMTANRCSSPKRHQRLPMTMTVAGCSRESESVCSLNSSPNQMLQRCDSIPMTANRCVSPKRRQGNAIRSVSPRQHHGHLSARKVMPIAGQNVTPAANRFVLLNASSSRENSLHRSSSCPTTPRRVGVLPVKPGEKPLQRIDWTAFGRCRSPSPAVHSLVAPQSGRMSNLTTLPRKAEQFGFGVQYTGPPLQDVNLLGPPVTSEISL